MLTIGSLFSGAGWLDEAVKRVFPDARTAFTADVCKVTKTSVGHYEPHRSPCTILAHRYPDAPNLGDVSLIDWSAWGGCIDILLAGFPCQDVSTAGRRAGLKSGTRTGLWSQVVRAIAELNPGLVVLENVPGIFTAPAAGDVEPCPWCVGDDPAGNLRALDAVLADLAALGLDAEWVVVPASGVGAAHKRERWFCLAWPAADTTSDGRDEGWPEPAGHVGRPDAPECCSAPVALLPTPDANADKYRVNGDGGRGKEDLLAASHRGQRKTPERWDEWTDDMRERHGNGNGHGKSLAIEAQRLLPTPRALDATGVRGVTPNRSDASNYRAGETLSDVGHDARWGDYAAAITRWERILGRPAPAPTMTSKKGNPQLSPRFTEWLMGAEDGWVTDVPGITRNEALKACGNGVVQQQGEAAIRWLWQYVPASVRARLLERVA